MPSRRQFLAASASAATAGLAGCAALDAPAFEPGSDASTDWRTPRYDAQNTAYAPNAAAPRDGVRERWTYTDAAACGAPAVADGTVFLPTPDALVALDAATGDERWRFTGENRGPWPRSPSVGGGLVYTTTERGTVYALDAETGDVAWSLADAGSLSGRPRLVDTDHANALFAGNDQGVLRRIHPETGEVSWQSDVFGAPTRMASSLSALYVGTRAGTVYTYAWAVEHDDPPTESGRTDAGGSVDGLVPGPNGVLVTAVGGPLRYFANGTAVDALPATTANAAPVKAGSTLLTAGYDALASYRGFDSEQWWRTRGRFDATPPVAAGDTLYASSGDRVHAFALDGGVGAFGYRFGIERWSHPTPGSVEGLAVADGALFAACQRTEDAGVGLYCLEPA